MNEIKTIRPEPLVIRRHFEAPPPLVFEAWSTVDHMRRWFSPTGYTVPNATVEFRPGGVIEICMKAADGQEFWSKGRYIEIDPPKRLVFTAGLVGDQDRPHFTALTTVTFAEDSGGTLLSVHQAYEIFDETALGSIDGAPEGWRTTLDKLKQEVARISEAAGRRSVVHGSFTLDRRFDASPARVFEALTDRAAKARWFEGGDGYTVIERSMDVRPGGRERLQGRWASGTISTFDAIYHDVVPDRRLIYSYEMHLDDRKISVSLATLDLLAEGTGTRLVLTEQGAFLDGYDDAGSREHGTRMLMNRLAASLLA